MRHIRLPPVPCPAVPHLSTYPHSTHVSAKILEYIKYVSILPTDFVCNISHSKKNSEIYYHNCTSLFMYSTGYYCQIVIKLKYSLQFVQKILISNFMKIRLFGTELFCVERERDGWTDGYEEDKNRF